MELWVNSTRTVKSQPINILFSLDIRETILYQIWVFFSPKFLIISVHYTFGNLNEGKKNLINRGHSPAPHTECMCGVCVRAPYV